MKITEFAKEYEKTFMLLLNCGHEGWLGKPNLMIESFDRCMDGGWK